MPYLDTVRINAVCDTTCSILAMNINIERSDRSVHSLCLLVAMKMSIPRKGAIPLRPAGFLTDTTVNKLPNQANNQQDLVDNLSVGMQPVLEETHPPHAIDTGGEADTEEDEVDNPEDHRSLVGLFHIGEDGIDSHGDEGRDEEDDPGEEASGRVAAVHPHAVLPLDGSRRRVMVSVDAIPENEHHRGSNQGVFHNTGGQEGG